MKECENAIKYANFSFELLKELIDTYPEYKDFKDNFKEASDFIEKLKDECSQK